MRSAANAALLASLLALCFLRSPAAETDATFGTWSLGQPVPGHLLATHSTLLRNDKILVVGGSSYKCCFAWGKEEARLYDVATDTWSAALPSPAPYGADKDAFCAGHAHDHTGGVIFQGGLLGYWEENGHGIVNSARYDVAPGTFTQITGAAAHWYPTLVAGVHHMFNFPGQRTEWTPTPSGDRIHKLAYGTTTWIPTAATLRTRSTYPRVALLPNGAFFIASPADADRRNYFFDPTTDTVAPAGHDVVPESQPGEVHGNESWNGSGVLLPLVPALGTYPQPRFALLNGVRAWVKTLDLADPCGSRWERARPSSPTGSGTSATPRCCRQARYS